MKLTNEVMEAIERARKEGRIVEHNHSPEYARNYPVKDVSKRPPKPLVAPSVKLSITVPCVVVSEANQRCHWAARHRRFKAQKLAFQTALSILGLHPHFWGEPVTITMTRIGGKPLDSDNLSGSCKGLRDAVAAWLQIDDGDSRLTWKYEQEPGPLQGVVITVEPT